VQSSGLLCICQCLTSTNSCWWDKLFLTQNSQTWSS